MNKPKIEKRLFPRVMLPVFYRTPRIQTSKQSVSNLSLGGVRIYSDERLHVGQALELEFFFPNGSTMRAIAKVVWTKELPPTMGAIYDVGMEFIRLSEKARKDLEDILQNK
jgi:hypothetical protein